MNETRRSSAVHRTRTLWVSTREGLTRFAAEEEMPARLRRVWEKAFARETCQVVIEAHSQAGRPNAPERVAAVARGEKVALQVVLLAASVLLSAAVFYVLR
jgi:hypothetical protein